MSARSRFAVVGACALVVLLGVAALARGDAFVSSTFGVAGGGDGQFVGPIDVATNSDGDVYVVDQRNNRIQQFKPNGTFVRKWGGEGSGAGQFKDPRSIAVDSGGKVYVADLGNDRVQKFWPDGKYIGQWPVHKPSGITASESSVYVLSGFAVRKFSTSGAFQREWTVYSIFGLGGIDTDPAGNVYVALLLGEVVEFTSEGTFVQRGFTADPFAFGIAVDPTSGDVWASAREDNRLGRMNAALDKALYKLSAVGSVTFEAPHGLAFDCHGNLNVADYGHNRIVRLVPAAALAPSCPAHIVGIWLSATYGEGNVRVFASCLGIRLCKGTLQLETAARFCKSRSSSARRLSSVARLPGGGCDVGRNTFRLRQSQTRVVSIRLSPKGQRLARQHPGLPVVVGADVTDANGRHYRTTRSLRLRDPSSITVACPASGKVGSPLAATASLRPAQGVARGVFVFHGGELSDWDHVVADGQGGRFSAGIVPKVPGRLTVLAYWRGDQGHAGAVSAPCFVAVTAAPPPQPPTTTTQAPTTTTSTTPAPTFTLSVTSDGGGSLESEPNGISCPGDCSELYPAGTEVTLRADAADGFSFEGWDGACGGSERSCTVTVDADKSVTAKFKKKKAKTPECSDGVDNDEDGLTDYAGQDPQCSSADDNNESK